MHGGGGVGARMIYKKLLGRGLIGVVWMKRRVRLWGEMV